MFGWLALVFMVFSVLDSQSRQIKSYVLRQGRLTKARRLLR